MSPQRVSCEGYYRRKPGRRRVEVTVENDNGRRTNAPLANVEVLMATWTVCLPRSTIVSDCVKPQIT